MNEMKTFFGPNLKAAKKLADEWIAEQTDIVLTLDSSAFESDDGWAVSVFYQKKPPSN